MERFALKGKILILCLILIVLVLMVGILPTLATPILDFGITAPTSGTISYGGGLNPLIGSGIEIDTVVGLSTPLNPNVTLTLKDAVLDFETGDLTSSDSSNWYFGGGPLTTITIKGKIPSLGINTDTYLLYGKFGTAQVSALGTAFKITGASFMDFKDDNLLEYYGLPTKLPNGDPFPYIGNFNISFNTTENVNPPSKFSSSVVLSGDVVNTPIPEPGTLILLGTGLIGLAGYSKIHFSRRKKR